MPVYVTLACDMTNIMLSSLYIDFQKHVQNIENNWSNLVNIMNKLSLLESCFDKP